MLKGIIKAFNEGEEVKLIVRTSTIDGVPFIFTTYYGDEDASMVWVDMTVEDKLVEVIQPYIRGEFEVEWLQPLA